MTPSGPTPATIVIHQLANGPTPPTAASASGPNALHTRVAEVVQQMGPPPWAKRIIADERQLVTLIASPPGGGNRPHWHREFDEWWVVLGGRLEWELTGGSSSERPRTTLCGSREGRSTTSGTSVTTCHCDSRSPCRPRCTTSVRASSADTPTKAPANGAPSAAIRTHPQRSLGGGLGGPLRIRPLRLRGRSLRSKQRTSSRVPLLAAGPFSPL